MSPPACACPANPSVGCVVPAHVKQSPQDPASLDPTYTRHISQVTLNQIVSLGLPADPATYTICYAYVTKANPALNHAMNATITAQGTIGMPELERLYQRFFWQARWESGVQRAGKALADELNQIVAMLAASVGASEENQHDLASASRRLADNSLDRAAVRSIVGNVIALTQKIEAEHGQLAARLRQSSEQVAELQASLDSLQAESLVDPLTGIGNRKRFDTEISRRLAEKKDGTLSLLMVDIDHFKRFNDTHGHQLGDDVLRLVAQTINGAIRKEDVAARYGGEELAVLLPGAPAEVAAHVAEKIRTAIAARELVRRNTGEKIGQVTVSIGVAEAEPRDTVQSFVERADRRLYAAKRQGRNRVIDEDAQVQNAPRLVLAAAASAKTLSRDIAHRLQSSA